MKRCSGRCNVGCRWSHGDTVKAAFISRMLKEAAFVLRDPREELWLVPYRLIRGTELEARIPDECINGGMKL